LNVSLGIASRHEDTDAAPGPTIAKKAHGYFQRRKTIKAPVSRAGFAWRESGHDFVLLF